MTDFSTAAVYRAMTRKDLFQLRAAFALDHAAAKHADTREFCQARMALITRVISEKESGRPCGCDPGENYICEHHRTAVQA